MLLTIRIINQDDSVAATIKIVSAACLHIAKKMYLLDQIGADQWRLNYSADMFRGEHRHLRKMSFLAGMVECEGVECTMRVTKYIKTQPNAKYKMLHLEQDHKTNTWRLLYSPELIPDISKVKCFEFIRDEEGE